MYAQRVVDVHGGKVVKLVGRRGYHVAHDGRLGHDALDGRDEAELLGVGQLPVLLARNDCRAAAACRFVSGDTEGICRCGGRGGSAKEEGGEGDHIEKEQCTK